MDLYNYSNEFEVIAVTNVSKIHAIIEIPVAIKWLEKLAFQGVKS